MLNKIKIQLINEMLEMKDLVHTVYIDLCFNPVNVSEKVQAVPQLRSCLWISAHPLSDGQSGSF